MALYPRVCIYTGGTWSRFLSPINLEFDPQPNYETIVRRAPFANSRTVYNRLVGWTIRVAGVEHAASTAAALAFKQSLRSALLADGREPNTVSISRWVDTAKLIGEVYRSCQAISGPEFAETKMSKKIGWRFSLNCDDPVVYQDAADGTQPGTSPYESWYPTPAGGTAAVPLVQLYSIPFYFGGLVELPSDADRKLRMQKRVRVPGAAGTTMHVKSIQILGVDSLMGSEGTTDIAVSDDEYGEGGSELVASLAYGASSTARTTGNIDVAAGGSIYIYPKDATGAHGGVFGIVEIQS